MSHDGTDRDRQSTCLESTNLESTKLESTQLDSAELESEEEDAPRNPFDNPLFLPILLFGLSLWFGYDGWINQDANMLEHRTFNRVGFAILVVGVIWSAVRARQELRLRAAEKASSNSDS